MPLFPGTEAEGGGSLKFNVSLVKTSETWSSKKKKKKKRLLIWVIRRGKSQTWLVRTIISKFRRHRQEDCLFKATPGLYGKQANL